MDSEEQPEAADTEINMMEGIKVSYFIVLMVVNERAAPTWRFSSTLHVKLPH